MKYTTNYNLKKPEESDYINIDDINYNFDAIDKRLKKNDEPLDYGIISGLKVYAQETPDMTVSVESGIIHMTDGERYAPAENTELAIAAADSMYPRKDIIYVNNSGIISYLAGALGAAGVAGSNTFTLTTNFVAGDTVTIGNFKFTATTDTQNMYNFIVGSDIATSMVNFATTLSVHYVMKSLALSTASSGVITITEKIAGTGFTPTISVSGTGVISSGTATKSKAAIISVPSVPASGMLLAEILVNPNTTTITQSLITDRRFLKYTNEDLSAKVKIISDTINDTGIISDDILPFKLKAYQAKGAMHGHTTTSDGKYSPTILLGMYKDDAYDFVALTDHDTLNLDAEVNGIIHIQSSEYFAYGNTVHMCAYNITKPRPDISDSMFNVQDSINFVRRNNGLTSIAHPQMGQISLDYNEALSLDGFDMMEVYTAFSAVHYENYIDNLLKRGKRFNLLAVDDFHTESANTFNGGWIVVNVDSKDQDSILEEIKNGNYYSSNGNDIALTLNNGALTATSSSSSNFTFITDKGRTTISAATSATYNIVGDEIYIRVESENVSTSRKAWSNPIFINKKDIKLIEVNMVKPSYPGTGTMAVIDTSTTMYEREKLAFVATKTGATCVYDENEFTITSGTDTGVAGLLFSSYNKRYSGRTIHFSFDIYRISGTGSLNARFYYSDGDETDVSCSSNRITFTNSNLYSPLNDSSSNLDNYLHYEISKTLPTSIYSILAQVRTESDDTVFKVRNLKVYIQESNGVKDIETDVQKIEDKLSKISILNNSVTSSVESASSTSMSQITAPFDGFAICTDSVIISSILPTSTRLNASIRVNGTVAATTELAPNTTAGAQIPITCVVPVSEGDVITTRIYQSSGSAINVTTNLRCMFIPS